MKRITKTRATKCVGALLTGVLMALAGGPAEAATKYKVDTMRYKNKGAYTAQPAAVFKHTLDSGTTVTCARINGNDIADGEHAAFDLTGAADAWKRYYKNPTGCPREPVEGSEVWMRIHIGGGDTKGCRKDGTKYFYYKNGGTVKYVTKGTTLNNNRCRHHSPSDSYKFN